MNPWWRFDVEWWPIVAGATPKPWPREMMLADLRYWQDRERMKRGHRPGKHALMERWGCTEWAYRSACKAESEWSVIENHPVTTPVPLPAQQSNADKRRIPAPAPLPNRATRVGRQTQTQTPAFSGKQEQRKPLHLVVGSTIEGDRPAVQLGLWSQLTLVEMNDVLSRVGIDALDDASMEVEAAKVLEMRR